MDRLHSKSESDARMRRRGRVRNNRQVRRYSCRPFLKYSQYMVVSGLGILDVRYKSLTP